MNTLDFVSGHIQLHSFHARFVHGRHTKARRSPILIRSALLTFIHPYPLMLLTLEWEKKLDSSLQPQALPFARVQSVAFASLPLLYFSLLHLNASLRS